MSYSNELQHLLKEMDTAEDLETVKKLLNQISKKGYDSGKASLILKNYEEAKIIYDLISGFRYNR